MDRSPPRVAVVYHFFAHYRTAVVESLARDTTHEWHFWGDLKDYDSDIKPAQFSDRVRFSRTRCVKLRGPVMWQRGLLGLALSPRWKAVIFLGSPNYVSTWISALLARLTGKRVLFWSHGWTKPPAGLRSVTRNLFYGLAHDLLLYGRWAKSIAIAQGFDPAHVHVVSNSLDVEAQRKALAAIPAGRPAEVRHELFGEADTPVLCCTTRLTRQRRLDMLLDAVAKLRERGRPANVAIIGDGPERAALQAQAERLGLKVAFLGACYDEARIGEVLLASNACVAPGQVGLTAMHALAFGVPVVSHGDPSKQMPEFESIVPGSTGSLFVEGNLESLATAIEPWILTSVIEPATRDACRTMIDRFWNPAFQTEVILRAVDGEPADDLFWLRPRSKEAHHHA
jgi:glycosyltransferase involved in cell wall biosynthesis